MGVLTCGLITQLCSTCLCFAPPDDDPSVSMAQEELSMPSLFSASGEGGAGATRKDSTSSRLLDELLGRQCSAGQLGDCPAAQDLGYLGAHQRIACRERSAEETARIIKHLCSRRLACTLQLVLLNTDVHDSDSQCLLKV